MKTVIRWSLQGRKSNMSDERGLRGFPIPEIFQNVLSKIVRKVESLYVRKEQAAKVDYTYETVMYRGVPIEVIKRISVEYDSTTPLETFTAIRTGGKLTGSVRVLQHRV